MWIAQTEGARFWLSVRTELQNRGVKDIFIACVDGLTGLPQAIETAYPHTRVQLCMVHLVRNSLRYVSYKHMRSGRDRPQSHLLSWDSDRSRVQSGTHGSRNGMRSIPTSASRGELDFPRVIPLFAFPQDIRKVIYTTNAIESVHMTLRKVTRNHRIFPSDEAVYKVVYLAMRNIARKWTMPIHDGKPALNRLTVAFAERFPDD